ncbi:MAG: SusC/RagA family TonB-linked outer membrane protein [Williamsia sp.]|nr:SusC/RagA family TonB-linked outer membrane protein [Williamsia sp.]
MRKLGLLVLAVALFTNCALAQTRTITGTVTDANGNPVPNASILIKGTRVGTSTDNDGKYSISIPAGAKILVISSVGQNEVEYSIGNKAVINASLAAADKNLQEIVVVGYGTQRRREATGSVVSVKGTAIAEKPVQSFESALAGKAAGVQITVPNGVVNNPPVFRIRGTNSISLSSYPLVVIDGVPTYTNDQGSTSAPANPLASINPNDIESIDIAKDAAATAIYGSRAANGVVFVTTKRGKSGRTRVSYDGWVGWSKAMRLPNLLDAFQYTDFKNAALANAKANNPSITGSFNLINGPDGKPVNTNWFDYVYNTGVSHSHNINLSGGNESTNYYFSTGYTDQEGILRKNEFKRINLLFNIDSRINKVVTIGGKIAYSNERNLIGGNSGSLPGEAFSIAGAAREALVLPPNVSPYNNDGTYNYSSASALGGGGNVVNGSNPVTYYNPVMIMDLNRSNNEANHLQSNAYLQIKPLSWITLKTSYGIDNLLIDNDIFYNPYHGDGPSTGTGPGGAATASLSKLKTWLWTNTAQFDHVFGDNHTVSLLVGNEQQRRTTNGFGINRRTLSDSAAYTVIQGGYLVNNPANMSLGENYLLSSFGRLNYNYANKYFVSGNIRQDEYSALGVKKGVFYGFSAGWEITKEKFWETAHLDNVFSSFKLRSSYGKVGNIAGIGNYATYSQYTSGFYGGASTLAYNTAGNPNLKWETSTKTDLGLGFGLFKDRVTADVAYYKNDINNLILNVPSAPSTGIANTDNAILANAGTMYNKGVEISLTATPVQTRAFSWSSSFNITFNSNKITALAPGLTEILGGLGGGTTEYVTKSVVGRSIGQLWVVRTAGVDPATGRRIFVNAAGNKIYYEFGTLPTGRYNYTNADGTRYERTNPDGTKSALSVNQSDDGVLYANTQAKFYGGWDNTFHYKGFDLNIIATYQGGGYIYYGTYAGLRDQRFWNNVTDVLRYWKKAGDVTDMPKPVYNDNVSNGSSMPLDVNVFKGDFIKLRTVQLSYNLPASLLGKAKITNARVYISGQNLAVITKYPGPDPEVSTDGNATITQGIDRNTLANGRTITAGVNIGF